MLVHRAGVALLRRAWSGVNSCGQRCASTWGGVAVPALGSRVWSIPKRHPFGFACVFTSFKTASADILVQTYMEGVHWREISWRRNLVFATFGFFYQGAFQYAVYIKLVGQRLLPNAAAYAALPIRAKLSDGKGFAQLIAQVGIANLIMDPFLCLPTYYTTKEIINGAGTRAFGNGIQTWKSNFWADMNASWKIWIPAQLINFSMMPLHFRVPFISIVSFGYCIVLSVMRGGESNPGGNVASEGRKNMKKAG